MNPTGEPHTGGQAMTVDEMCDFLKSHFDGEKEVAAMDFYGNVGFDVKITEVSGIVLITARRK